MELQDPLKKFIKETIKDAFQAEMALVKQELTKVIQEKIKEIINSFFGKLSAMMLQLEERVEQAEQFKVDFEKKLVEVQKENEEIRNNINCAEERMDLLQFRLMQNAIRVRGLPELEGENLIDIFTIELAKMFNVHSSDILLQIEKIYRVNSQIASERKLPRDVVIYFTNRRLRDGILQISYKKNVLIKDQKVLIFKEIPYKILKKRKEVSCLVNVLKERQIKYRWEIPFGLSLSYGGQNYCLDTPQKANDFYNNVLKKKNPSKPEPKKAKREFKNIKEEVKVINIKRKDMDKSEEQKADDEYTQRIKKILEETAKITPHIPWIKTQELDGAFGNKRIGFHVKA